MKIISGALFILFLISCEKKQNQNPGNNQNTAVSQNRKTDVFFQKMVTDSGKSVGQSLHEGDQAKITSALTPKSVDCKDVGGNMDNGFVTECIYKNYNLTEAYNEFRQRNKTNDDGMFLEAKMPASNYKAALKEYPTSVNYVYSNANMLEVEILFPGGVTTITFKAEDDDVRISTNHSPD